MQPTSMLASIIAFILSCSFLAQAEKPNRPTAKITSGQILDKYIEVTGGVEARRRLETLELHGSLSVPPFQNFGSDFHFYSKSPSGDVFKLETRSHGMVSLGHDADKPFFVGGADGIAVLNGISVWLMEQNLLLLLESDWHQYSKIELVGLAQVKGRWTYALRFTPKIGDPQLRYFDSDNFTMLRVDFAQHMKPRKSDPDIAYLVQVYFSELTEAAGVKIPKKIEYRSSTGNLRLSVENIKTNLPMADETFKKH